MLTKEKSKQTKLDIARLEKENAAYLSVLLRTKRELYRHEQLFSPIAQALSAFVFGAACGMGGAKIISYFAYFIKRTFITHLFKGLNNE